MQRAKITPLGLEGDVLVDIKHHGGPDQAVYAYTRADYDWWEAALGRDLPNGTFGKNLTLDRWPADVICVGDRLQIGEVLIEVTSPRIPCLMLDAQMGIKGFTKTFLNAQRPDLYFRVVNRGTISRGDGVSVQPARPMRKRLLDWPGVFAPRLETREQMVEWMSVPVHYRMKADLDAAIARIDP